MYINAPVVTLKDAILIQVNEFAQNNQTFSVFDITREVRKKTANGDIEIPEVEVSGTSFKFDIPHNKVKTLFMDIYNSGFFDATISFTRDFNGKYWEYTPTCTNNPCVTTPPTVNITPQVPVTSITGNNSAIPQASITPSDLKLNEYDTMARVTTYLSRCKSRCYRPTLKQVQSAIKRDISTGWSCEELKTLITTKLNYSVVDSPDCVYSTQVVI